jgi:hypothetical protein
MILLISSLPRCYYLQRRRGTAARRRGHGGGGSRARGEPPRGLECVGENAISCRRRDEVLKEPGAIRWYRVFEFEMREIKAIEGHLKLNIKAMKKAFVCSLAIEI